MNSTIYTNMDSVRNYNVFNTNSSNASKAMERATTGLKIASAKDNASQYAISAKMLERINSNNQASQNVQNDNALLKTAEDGIANTISILQTLKAKAIDAANDSNTNADRATIQKEIDKFVAQIDTNASTAKFNGKALLDGSASGKVAADTNALVFAEISSETQAKKGWELLGISSNSASYIKVDVAWTDGSGNAKSASSANNANGGTLNTLLAAGVTAMGNATTVSNTTATPTSSGVNDASGTAINVGTGFGLKSTGVGRSNNISGVTMKLSVVADPTKYYTVAFDQIQMAKTAKAQDDSLTFQIGEEAGLSFNADINDVSTKGLNLTGLSVISKEKATSAIGAIDAALRIALEEQTKIGATEQRLGFTADTLETINENLQASASTIRDANMAKEISDYMKWNVLMQSSQYMLAQSNQNAYSVINLLQ